MVDRVRLLKLESTRKGSQNDIFPTEINPDEDYASMKGISFREAPDRLMDLDSEGNIQIRDKHHTTPRTFKSITSFIDNIVSLFRPNKATYYSQILENSIETNKASTWTDTGLQITPSEGKYLLLFNASMFSEGAGNTISSTRVTLGGSLVPGSIRETRTTTVMLLGLIGGNNIDAGGSNIIMPITCNGTQQLKIQYTLGSSGTKVTMKHRALTLIRIDD